uniref:Uncharacterized protein n=1 Tax=Arundo donax TaxID=35708 RepID=A0A0A9HI10_ARUDO
MHLAVMPKACEEDAATPIVLQRTPPPYASDHRLPCNAAVLAQGAPEFLGGTHPGPVKAAQLLEQLLLLAHKHKAPVGHDHKPHEKAKF